MNNEKLQNYIRLQSSFEIRKLFVYGSDKLLIGTVCVILSAHPCKDTMRDLNSTRKTDLNSGSKSSHRCLKVFIILLHLKAKERHFLRKTLNKNLHVKEKNQGLLIYT